MIEMNERLLILDRPDQGSTILDTHPPQLDRALQFIKNITTRVRSGELTLDQADAEIAEWHGCTSLPIAPLRRPEHSYY